jgi:hypothetical protein
MQEAALRLLGLDSNANRDEILRRVFSLFPTADVAPETLPDDAPLQDLTDIAAQIPLPEDPIDVWTNTEDRFKHQTPDDEINDFVKEHPLDTSLLDTIHGIYLWWHPSDSERENYLYETLYELANSRYYGEYDTKFMGKHMNSDGGYIHNYYLNSINKLTDIRDYLLEIAENEPKPFKVNFSFGVVVEDTRIVGENPFWIEAPNLNSNMMKLHTATTINNVRQVEKYFDYIESQISFLATEVHHDRGSSTRYIGIHSICLQVTQVLDIVTGAYRDTNLCFWESFARMRYPNECGKGGKQASLIAKQLYKMYYNRSYSNTYQGFGIFTESLNFYQRFHVQVCIYRCQGTQFYHERDLPTVVEPDTEQLHIYVRDDNTHCEYIKNIDSILGVVICPKCQNVVGTSNQGHGKRTLDNHLRWCDVKKKKVTFQTVETPYCPAIYHNTAVTEYITFDFETVYIPVDLSKGKTFIDSQLDVLSVASCVHTHDGDTTFYYDRRDGNFVELWLDKLFYYANTLQGYMTRNSQGYEIKTVIVLGYNSGKFDLFFVLKYLSTTKYKIEKALGALNNYKVLIMYQLENPTIRLKFMDARNFVAGGSLRDFVKNFGTINLQKEIFFYDGFDITNYNQVLSQTTPLPKEAFHDRMHNKDITDEDYLEYITNFTVTLPRLFGKESITHWDYLQYYNERDVKVMISPIDNLIRLNAEYGVDMLRNCSLSGNASAIKYMLAYRDFDPKQSYCEQTEGTPFSISINWLRKKMQYYKIQDQKAGRSIDDIIDPERDFDKIVELYDKKCYLCGMAFTRQNKPSLDRLDNRRCHAVDNVKFACFECNRFRKNKPDIEEVRFDINLRNYCKLHRLPMVLVGLYEAPNEPNEPPDETKYLTYHIRFHARVIYQIIRSGITGGLSTVMHRCNLKNITPINRLIYVPEEGIVSVDGEHIMTHVIGVDFNSLYPSAFSSEPNRNIPYTGGQMYMPGTVEDFKIFDANEPKQNIIDILMTNRERLFIAEIKGHIDMEASNINDIVNFPPIFRKLKYPLTVEQIGKYMYDLMTFVNGKVPTGAHKKLTMLLSTHGEWMSFSSYYLWFLIDCCHFIIDDVRYIIYFTKHTGFNAFVKEMMAKRVEAKTSGNSGKELFYKMCMNGSYGYDGMNTEKFTKLKIGDEKKFVSECRLDTYVSAQRYNDGLYTVQCKPKSCSCRTCIQEAFFTLDNAKYWYLNFVYNFMYKCLDMSRIHFIEGDTDSAYWAVSGDPNMNKTQDFTQVIKDRQFYDEAYGDWFPRDITSFAEQKKILGLMVENRSDNCIALAPKCYDLFDGTLDLPLNEKARNKGTTQKARTLQYYEALFGMVQTAENISLGVKNALMSRIRVTKMSLNGIHTKMVVLENNSCLPFLYKPEQE